MRTVAASSPAEIPFVLYVEGPRDRSLLEAWAWRVAPALGRALPAITVILGGCQPLRAAEHFRGVRASTATARGLCVLDRDVGPKPMPARAHEPGLEFFTWGRRHIESYLLVPAAICRAARVPPGDRRRARWFAQALPAEHDERAFGALDAKPLFAHHGVLQQLLGRPLRPVQVARAMRHDELHTDVHGLLERLRAALGLAGADAGSAAPRRVRSG
jgi:hypothetical protein